MIFKIFRNFRIPIFMNIFQDASYVLRESDFFSKFSGYSARGRDFPQDFKNLPHGSAMIFRYFQDARERDFS